MTTVTRCDGCGVLLSTSLPVLKNTRERVIHGDRTNKLHGGGLPDSDFDWCDECALAAFRAVAARKAACDKFQARAAGL